MDLRTNLTKNFTIVKRKWGVVNLVNDFGTVVEH